MSKKRSAVESPPEGPQPDKPPESTEDMLARMQRESRNILLRKLLDRPFPPAQLKWKPLMVKNNRAIAFAYIDARVVEDRLDDVFGVEGWKDAYEVVDGGSVICRLSVRYAGGEWVTKEDVGSPSEQPDAGDRMKAAVSDALKRAAVKFGIGRYLYRLTNQWCDYDPVKKRLTQTPQLPEWAKPPAEEKTAPVYEEAGEVEAPEPPREAKPAAAVTPTPKKEPEPQAPEKTEKAKTEKSEKPAIDVPGITEARLTHWRHELTGCSTPEDVTKLLPALADEPGFAKDAIWKLINNEAEAVGWRYNPTKKAFYGAAKANEAIPF